MKKLSNTFLSAQITTNGRMNRTKASTNLQPACRHSPSHLENNHLQPHCTMGVRNNEEPKQYRLWTPSQYSTDALPLPSTNRQQHLDGSRLLQYSIGRKHNSVVTDCQLAVTPNLMQNHTKGQGLDKIGNFGSPQYGALNLVSLQQGSLWKNSRGGTDKQKGRHSAEEASSSPICQDLPMFNKSTVVIL